MDEKRIELQAKIAVLSMLIDRECNCDKAKCAEHFEYMRKLKYDYECKLEDYETETDSSN